MPCHAAMNDKPLIVMQDTPLEDVLTKLTKEKANAALLVDEQGVYAGLFTLSGLFENLLPVQVNIAGGADMSLSAAPGVAKRLLKVKPLPVSQFALRRAQAVYPQTPLWEGIRIFLDQNSKPLVVVDETSKKPLGLIHEQTILAELNRMNEA